MNQTHEGAEPTGRITDEAVLEERRAAMYQKVERTIEEVGWYVVGVFPVAGGPPSPGFTYSVGFEKTWGHPEVVMFGMSPETAHGVLATIAERLAAGDKFEAGERYSELLRDLDATFRAVPKPGKPLNLARHYYGRDIEALQLVWPDTAGKFPWEDGFDEELLPYQPLADGTWD